MLFSLGLNTCLQCFRLPNICFWTQQTSFLVCFSFRPLENLFLSESLSDMTVQSVQSNVKLPSGHSPACLFQCSPRRSAAPAALNMSGHFTWWRRRCVAPDQDQHNSLWPTQSSEGLRAAEPAAASSTTKRHLGTFDAESWFYSNGSELPTPTTAVSARKIQRKPTCIPSWRG